MASFIQKATKLTSTLNNLGAVSCSQVAGGRRSYHAYSKQLSQPLNKKPKFVSAEEALQCLESGEWES